MSEGDEKKKRMHELEEKIRSCDLCPLHAYRKNAVPGEGSLDAKVMFIGEAPGRNEDIQGRPFVGAAGKLLDQLLELAGLKREEVYITNVVKCRPPNNRDPASSEKKACQPYLEEQIRIISPKLIVTLGRHSMMEILELSGHKASSIMRERGKVRNIRLFGLKVLLMPTLHPAAALYNPKTRKLLEEDFLRIKDLLRALEPGESGLERYF
ncbi:MAG: uracil-DNA glycosylase [Thermoproteota archaeon]|nr:MAG: uracil-DNA glycosylase [Candidatus Korarchaeota archaeon]